MDRGRAVEAYIQRCQALGFKPEQVAFLATGYAQGWMEHESDHGHGADQPPAGPGEPQPQGSNGLYTQVAGESDRNHELNGRDRPGHYGRRAGF